MSDGSKFSFCFGTTGGPASGSGSGSGSAPAPAPKAGPWGAKAAAAPMSNMEMLMAQAKAKAGNNASGASSAIKKAPAALFADDEDEDENVAARSRSGPSLEAGPSRLRRPSSAANGNGNGTTKALNGAAPPTSTGHTPMVSTQQISRASRKAQEAALSVDQSIFDYDSIYDSMKAAERAAEQSKKAESEERKPKYIESFLASAQTRRLDKLRAEEKMLEREREKEGDEFADKEKFVTDAYRRQMEDVRKAEEEEKAREEAMRKSKKGPGLTAFYKTMLDTDEAKHAAAVAATTSSGPSAGGAGPSLAIRPPTSKVDYDDEEEYDPFLAREAKAEVETTAKKIGMGAGASRIDEETGKEVEINDEGEVVDKRSLLKAGLNIMKRPSSSSLPNSLLTAQRNGGPSNEPYKSRAVGAAASHGERMERERRRLAEQVKEDQERKRRAEEDARRAEEEEKKRRREGDDGEAQKRREAARERALARKRAREAEGGGDAASKKSKDE